ncbi:histidine kinase [Sulfuriferula sp. GW1]|uniref:sensor histidine kinase n=1 Tax=Sulfuriferula sp. GW1 TaxID=3345111 RepID=UPI0039AE9CE1
MNNNTFIDIPDPRWLPILMNGSLSEIYVMDCDTLYLVHANDAAYHNLQYCAAELAGMTMLNVTRGLSEKKLTEALRPLRASSAEYVSLELTLVRRDGTTYPINFRVFLSHSMIIAIGNDQTASIASAQALGLSESRFHAIVSNMPGLVYQFVRQHNGEISFPYLSDGCHALLGVTPSQLLSDPTLFAELILPEDLPSYIDSMMASARTLSAWNWEGRIWIEKWKDTKWINLRATPRAIDQSKEHQGIAWDGVMTNITQSRLEKHEIRSSREQLAELSAHIELVKEQERTRIAREIHDDLGGNLTAIKMAMALLIRRLPETPELLEKAHYVEALADRSIESAHRIAADLRPSVLDFGIVAALEWHAKEFEKQAGIPCKFSSNCEEIQLDTDQATALFRIFQEALTNIAKHAHASRVTVKLALSKRCVELEVADNGRGINAADRMKPKSFGIRGMVERANALGGKLHISPLAAGGSLVRIKIPLSTT